MRCELCGKLITKCVDQKCVDCYIDSNLPTEVLNRPWVRVKSSKRQKSGKGGFDDELASVIASMAAEISEDKTKIILELDERMVSVPLSVEELDKLAQESGILIGKWLIYRNSSEINAVWKTIAKSTINGELGISAKAGTAKQSKRRHVICAYTSNYLDLVDVMRVREKLEELGFVEKLCYKPDIYTYLGIYYKTTPLSPCRYRK